jgi:hypothetical protein
LLLLCLALAVMAAPLLEITTAIANQLGDPQGYLDAVLGGSTATEVLP